MLMFLEVPDRPFNPLEIDTGFMFWSLVVFVITLIILKKFAWGPLMQAIDTREARIRDDLEAAERARVESEKAMKDHQEQLAKSAEETRQMLADAREAGERSKQTLLSEAKEQVEALKAQAERDIAAARDKAMSDIKKHVVEVAMGASRQIVGKSVDEAEHKRLVDEMLNKSKEVA